MENPQVKSVIFLLYQVTSQEEIITSRIRAGNCFQSNFLSLLVCQLYQHFQEKRVLEFRTGVFRYIKYFLFLEPFPLYFTQSSAAAAAKSLQSCPILSDPIDSSPPGSSVPGILQARILEWVAFSFSNARMHAKLLQSCLTLCDLMDSSPPGSSVHEILQARILEWVATSFSTANPQRFSKHELDKTKLLVQYQHNICIFCVL